MKYRVVIVFESGTTETLTVEAKDRTEAARIAIESLYAQNSNGLVSLTVVYGG